ncbi:MAG: MerR family transcriptional regulator [Chloroflexi bacterium]|nr:MAG: MerR family transcriptional regulator [Chloroflexota bacterium]
MPSANNEPTYNLKAVVRETALKPDTLRVWERRYGLPQPKRTAGGHRLYSRQDINILKWLVARQQEGLSISRAVKLWRQLEAEGKSPAAEKPYPGAFVARPGAVPATGQALEQLCAAWIEACVKFDEQAAERILTQAFALYPAELTCTRLLMPALAEIGQGWYDGKYTVQQEHFASALAIRRLEALLVATPAPTRPERLIIGCPPDEEHTLGPLLLSLLLRRQGLDVIYLGANVPLEHFAGTVLTTRPQLIVLSAQRLPTAASLQQMARLAVQQNVLLAFGGRIFNELPALRRRIPGHFLGNNLNEAPRVVEHLLFAGAPEPTDIPPISEPYRQALEHYSALQTSIDAAVRKNLRQASISEQQLSVAGYNVSRTIIAALTLGDVKFMGSEVEWASKLLVNHQLPPDLLCRYFEAYLQAAQEKLDQRGALVITWLGQVVANCDELE